MVGIRRLPTADQARLLSHKSQMNLIADATWFRKSELALVDASHLHLSLGESWSNLCSCCSSGAAIGEMGGKAIIRSWPASFASNASSTSWASLPVSEFLAGRER